MSELERWFLVAMRESRLPSPPIELPSLLIVSSQWYAMVKAEIEAGRLLRDRSLEDELFELKVQVEGLGEF